MTEMVEGAGSWPVGRSDSGLPVPEWSPQRERCWWVGKPWRRVEVEVTDTYYRGEMIDRVIHFQVGLGLRRLGWHFSWSATRSVGSDYSEDVQ